MSEIALRESSSTIALRATGLHKHFGGLVLLGLRQLANLLDGFFKHLDVPPVGEQALA